MKKLFSLCLFAALFLLTGCGSADIKEADLIGSWQLVSATEDGIRDDFEATSVIWEFAENHAFYISHVQKGSWALTGDQLYISHDDIEWTVSKLTTTSLVLRYDEYDEGDHFWLLYEFSRVH